MRSVPHFEYSLSLYNKFLLKDRNTKQFSAAGLSYGPYDVPIDEEFKTLVGESNNRSYDRFVVNPNMLFIQNNKPVKQFIGHQFPHYFQK